MNEKKYLQLIYAIFICLVIVFIIFKWYKKYNPFTNTDNKDIQLLNDIKNYINKDETGDFKSYINFLIEHNNPYFDLVEYKNFMILQSLKTQNKLTDESIIAFMI